MEDGMPTEVGEAVRAGSFQHDALFYSGIPEFVDRTSTFIRDSVSEGEPILIVVSAEKIELLRDELKGDPEGVRFADMATVGQNPARIIPAWREFVAEQAPSGRRFRGIGEPIWATRSASELVECERHEALLNLAFAGTPAWWLACPYDTQSLPPTVLDEAKRNHSHLVQGSERLESSIYRGLDDVDRPFEVPLPEPPGPAIEYAFGPDGESLSAVRVQVGEAASAFGLEAARGGDLVLVVNEVVTNSVRHGGGHGLLRIWEEDSSLICEVSDAGRIEDPLVGRRKPPPDRGSGFGLWLANQLCDLVQIRSFPTGSVVRLHLQR
jgi:anti-sigma regulatory factor (Ser/Thr protein kinase)